MYSRSIVLELPPAPAALVLVGLAFATLSALSAAAFLLMAVLGPPGGDRFRPLLTPAEAGGEIGEDGRGEDIVRGCNSRSSSEIIAAGGRVLVRGKSPFEGWYSNFVAMGIGGALAEV